MISSHQGILQGCGCSFVGGACLVGLVLASCNEYRETPLIRSVPVALVRPADLKTMESAIETALAQAPLGGQGARRPALRRRARRARPHR